MDGSIISTVAEESLFFQAFAEFGEVGDVLGLLNAFSSILSQKYESLSRHVASGFPNPITDRELSRLKGERDLWDLMKILSQQRLESMEANVMRVSGNQSIDSRMKMMIAMSDSSLPYPLDDQMVLLHALDQEPQMKELLLIVKWLESTYNNEHSMSALHGSTTPAGAMSAHHYNIINATKLDLNGRIQEGRIESRENQPGKEPSTSASNRTAVSTNISSADHDLSYQIWNLYRAGRYQSIRHLLLQSGQIARSSSLNFIGLTSLFTDPEFIQNTINELGDADDESFDDDDVDNSPRRRNNIRSQQVTPNDILRAYMVEEYSNDMSKYNKSLNYVMSDDGERRRARGIIHTRILKRAASLAASSSSSSSSSSSLLMSSGIAATEPSDSIQRDESQIVSSRSSSINPYELALYASFGGHLDQVLKVCTSWEDVVWAHLKYWISNKVETSLNRFPLAWSSPMSVLKQQIGKPASDEDMMDDMDSQDDVDVEELKHEEQEFEHKTSSESSASNHIKPSIFDARSKSVADILNMALKDANDRSRESSSQTSSTAITDRSRSIHHRKDESTILNDLNDLFSKLMMSSNPTIKKQAFSAFRQISSQIMIGDAPQLISLLYKIVNQNQEEKLVAGESMEEEEENEASRRTTSSAAAAAAAVPSSLLRFAVHLVLCLKALNTSLFDLEEDSLSSNQSGRSSSFMDVSGGPSSSLYPIHVKKKCIHETTFILSEYIRHLVISDQKRLIAQYCAKIPSSQSQVGIELYVKYLRGIKTTKDREVALSMANEAGLNSQLIASLLVEDVIRAPNINKNTFNNINMINKNTIKNDTVSLTLNKPSGLQSQRDNKQRFGLFSTPKQAAFERSSDVDVDMDGKLFLFSSDSVPPEDAERIHALEWLALDDSSNIQRFECLSHSNALNRAFILSHSISSSQLLVNTVNNLLFSLFQSLEDPNSSVSSLYHNIDQTNPMSDFDQDNDDTHQDNDSFSPDHDSHQDQEDSLIEKPKTLNKSSLTAWQQRNALREYFSLSTYLQALQAYSEWRMVFVRRREEQKEAKNKKSKKPTFNSSGPYLDHDHHDIDSIDTLDQLDGEDQDGNPLESDSSSQIDQLAQNAIDSLFKVVYFPHGWLSDISTPSQQSTDNYQNSNRSLQLSLLKQLCLPEVFFLLQHVLISSHRFDECIQLANHLASQEYLIYKHFSSQNLKAFMKRISNCVVQKLKSMQNSNNTSNANNTLLLV